MNNRPLRLLNEEPFALSKRAAALRAELNEQIDALNVDRAAYLQQREALAAIGAGELTRQQVDQLKSGAFDAFDLDRRELSIRQRIAGEWYPLVHAERVAAHEEAFKKTEKAKADVRAKLASIGFEESYSENGQVRQVVTPGMIGGHPAVRAAWAQQQTVHGLMNASDAQRENREAIKALEAELENARAKLARVA